MVFFTSKAFQVKLCLLHQIHTTSSVGGKYQNGIAECAIKTTSYLVCAMLVHTVLKWSKSYNFDLWSFALSHVGYIRNHLPGLDNLSQKRNGVTLCLQLIIIFAVSSHGVVPAMCLTPTFKMVKRSPSGNPVVAKASSLKSPLLTLLQYGPDSQPQDQPNYPAVSCPV